MEEMERKVESIEKKNVEKGPWGETAEKKLGRKETQ